MKNKLKVLKPSELKMIIGGLDPEIPFCITCEIYHAGLCDTLEG